MDETVYHMCDVPVDIPGAIDTCLLILHDWSNDLTLDPVEIDKERGVVHEEWRTRMTACYVFKSRCYPSCMPEANTESAFRLERWI